VDARPALFDAVRLDEACEQESHLVVAVVALDARSFGVRQQPHPVRVPEEGAPLCTATVVKTPRP